MNKAIRRRLITAAVFTLVVVGALAQAADVVTVGIQDLDDAATRSVPVTFGQVFKLGHVPASSQVVARELTDGARIPLQVDKKATHDDGSLRHAVLTARLPRFDDTDTLALTLSTSAHETSGPVVRLTDLLASSFSAQVALELNGRTFTADARDWLRRASAADQWLSGPLVSEWIVGGPVRDGSGNSHAHLAVYFHVRAYAGLDQVRVDVVIENDWTFVKHPAAFAYDATIIVGGRKVYESEQLKHYHHTRWHKQFWWGREPGIYIRHDVEYLQATGAVPNYPELRPSEDYLNSMLQTSTPMGHADLTEYMGSGGAQDQIGPLPRWTATYVVSGDRRAFNSMLVNDDSAASFSVHYRDEDTGKPVSIADHPEVTLSIDGYVPEPSGENPNFADAAHQPSIGFVSYLLTGDYFYLEELQFWTSWNHLDYHSEYRQYKKGIFGVQVRGHAWSLRNLAQAAYATPDEHPYKALLVASVRHNLEYNESLYASNSSANQLGALQSYDGYNHFAPWMDDFYTWTTGYLVDLGFDAEKMRNWKARFPVGRMGTAKYCYVKAASYQLTVGKSDKHWWPDFSTLYERNFGHVGDCSTGAEMEGYPDSPSGFPSNLRPALAVAVDAGMPGAEAAWERLVTSAVQPDYSDYPNWAVVPGDESIRSLADHSTGRDAQDNRGSAIVGTGAADPGSLMLLTMALSTAIAGSSWRKRTFKNNSHSRGPQRTA